jgi:hypothetical protein
MNSLPCWQIDGSPDFVSVVFAYDLAFGLKIGVYGQKLHLQYSANTANIRLSPKTPRARSKKHMGLRTIVPDGSYAEILPA